MNCKRGYSAASTDALKRKRGYSPAAPNSIKRRQGAQLGNHNAFKHGFYSDQFKQAERVSLSQIKNTDLSNEIGFLRAPNTMKLQESPTDQRTTKGHEGFMQLWAALIADP